MQNENVVVLKMIISFLAPCLLLLNPFFNMQFSLFSNLNRHGAAVWLLPKSPSQVSTEFFSQLDNENNEHGQHRLLYYLASMLKQIVSKCIIFQTMLNLKC